MFAVTCATGYASVFKIGGLYVACVELYFGKCVSLESNCKLTQSASRVHEHAGSRRLTLVGATDRTRLLTQAARRVWRLADRCRQPDANAFRLIDQAAAELISRRALAHGS